MSIYPYIFEKNNSIKGRLRMMVEGGLTLILQGGIPVKYWSYAFYTIVYLRNMLPTPLFVDKSPYDMLYNSVKLCIYENF